MNNITNNFGFNTNTKFKDESVFNSYLRFDGVNEVLVTNNRELNFTDGVNDLDFTVVIKATQYNASATNKILLGKLRDTFSSSGQDSWLLGYFATRIKGFVLTTGSNYIQFTTDPLTILDGTKYHIVFTYEGATETADIYIDGLPVTTTKGTVGTYTGMNILNINTAFGGRPSGSGSNVDADVYYGAVYNRILTQEEVTKLYKDANPASIDGLEFYSNFNKNTYWDGADIVNTPISSTNYTIGKSLNMEEIDIQ